MTTQRYRQSTKPELGPGSRFRARGARILAGSLVLGLALGVSGGIAPAFAKDDVVVSATAQSEEPNDIASDLVAAFLKAAAGKGAGFIFSKLVPGAESAQLDAISKQLKELTDRVNEIQAKVAAIEVKDDKYEYTNLYGKFQTYRQNVIELNDSLALVGTAAARMAMAQDAYDKDPAHTDAKVTKEYEDAKSNLEGRKANFVSEGKEKDPLGNVDSIRNLLYPESGTDTIVDAFGQYLMGTNRIVNADSSKALRNVYDTLEQFQALAAFMEAEFIIAHTPKGGDPNEELAPKTAAFDRYIKSQRAVLPEAIPAGTAIDVGSDYSKGTVGKPLFRLTPDAMPWFYQNSGAKTQGVPDALAKLNATKSPDVTDGKWVATGGLLTMPVFLNGSMTKTRVDWKTAPASGFNKT